MNFDFEFRKQLEDNLRNNIFSLQESSLILLKKSLNSYFRIIVNTISDYNIPYYLDYDSAKNIIIESLYQKDFPILRLRKLGYNQNLDNEIFFSLKEKKELVMHSPEEIQYRFDTKKLEKDCEHEFWEDQENIDKYNKLLIFEYFNNIIIPEADLLKYQNTSKYLYNENGWLDYIMDLVKTTFPEFVFDKTKSSKKVLRFLKPLNNEILFGFEYDISSLKSEMKRGEINLPYYFNLIIINNKFKASTSHQDYVLNYNDTILSLGVLGNPFFFEPCFSLLTFQAVEMHYDENNPNGFIYKYKRQFIQNSDGTFTIEHPKDYGEKLKKHAFFYMEALRYSSTGYLDYIEKSIRDSINE